MTYALPPFKRIEPHFSVRDHIVECLNTRGLVIGTCCISLFGALATFATLFYAGALSL